MGRGAFGIAVRGAAWALLFVAGACGTAAPAAADAAPADAADPGCALEAGRTYIVAEAVLEPSTVGFDLGGDGVVDNALGLVPASVRQSVNDGFAEAILGGGFPALVHMVGWTEPLTSPQTLRIQIFSGRDADQDPTTNLTGQGEFFVGLGEFDVNCRAIGEAREPAVLDAGRLTASWAEFGYPVPGGRGTFTLVDTHLEATFAPDLTGFDALLGGGVTFCALSVVPFPGGQFPGSVLDVLVNDPAIQTAVVPDLDLDGDGFERVVGDGVSVVRCVDGDGTSIPGRECPCHPAIADAFSVGLSWRGVGARIVGVQP